MKKLIITSLCFVLLTMCKTKSQSQSIYLEKVTNIKKLLENTELSKNYHGSVLIADGSKVLLEKSFGVNYTTKEPNQLTTKYNYASMGKMFTSLAIMQLREKKKLTLEQTIGEILPNYPNNEAKQITVKQLLSHTSGLGDYFSPEFDQKKGSIKALKDFLPFFVNNPLEFKPGEQMQYSNAGYIVLGLIIEEITGKDYRSYVIDSILKPLNMNSTDPLYGSAGGGNSTVKDFHKFALGLKNNTLINKESFSLMITDHFNHGYGYGMSLRDLNGKKIYGHNGGAPGTSGELDMVVGESLIIITLSNRSSMDGWAQLRTNIRKEFFGSTPEIEEFLNTEKVVKTYKEEGLEAASKMLSELNNNISDKNTFRYAQEYLGQRKPEKAVDILKLIVQAYPDQWYPYSFLADFQLQTGQKEEAIKNYKKSLELNPDNKQAIEQLKKIE